MVKKIINALDIDQLVANVQKSYGKDKSKAEEVSAGNKISFAKDDKDFVLWKDSPWHKLTGVPGIPFGKVVQIAGKPDSGKSTHAMQFMTQAQNQNVLVIFWDTEKKFSSARFDKYFGGDSSALICVTSRLILDGADRIERIIHEAKKLDESLKILIVWDSVGGSLAKNENVIIKKDSYEGSMDGSKQMAAASKENGTALRGFVRLMEAYKDTETNQETIAILLINQTYSNIGSPGQKQSGGQKVEYFSSIVVQLTRKSDINIVKNKIKMKTGIVTRAKVSKNHLFDGESSVSELDLAISAGGIKLVSEMKVKNSADAVDVDDDGEEIGEIEIEEE